MSSKVSKSDNSSSDNLCERPLWSKLLWFVALWGGGVGTVLIVAMIIRKMLGL